MLLLLLLPRTKSTASRTPRHGALAGTTRAWLAVSPTAADAASTEQQVDRDTETWNGCKKASTKMRGEEDDSRALSLAAATSFSLQLPV